MCSHSCYVFGRLFWFFCGNIQYFQSAQVKSAARNLYRLQTHSKFFSCFLDVVDFMSVSAHHQKKKKNQGRLTWWLWFWKEMLLKASAKSHRYIGSELVDKHLFAPAVPRRTQLMSSSSCRVMVRERTSTICQKLEFLGSLCYFPAVQHAYMIICLFICLCVCVHVQ